MLWANRLGEILTGATDEILHFIGGGQMLQQAIG